jgi:cysteine synthase A
MRAYGADIELVAGDISDAKERADEIESEAGAIQLRQFENPENPRAHYLTTGPEIIEQIGDRTVDALVAGVGTGGTITGIGRRLREAFPGMEIVAVEPAESPVLSGGEPAAHDFQGMGPGFVSPNLDTDLLDDVETVTVEEAEAECRRLAREEGILVGQSSGASNLAAKRVAERLADPDATAADADPSPEYVLPEETGGAVGSDVEDTEDDDPPLVITVYWDSGERYMSTGMFG